jgi:DNA-binding LacI/PurR family transcriptional regulator
MAIAELIIMANRLGPGTRLPVFAELCRQLNVSKMTLDGALAELERRDIIHRAPGIGIFVSHTVRHSVAVLYPKSLDVSPFWRLVIEAVKNHIEKADLDYSLRPIYENEDIGDVVEQLKAAYDKHLFRGAVTLTFSAEVSGPFSSYKIPLVTFGGDADCAVTLDTVYIVNAGVLQLKSMGCQRIGAWETARDEHEDHGAPERIKKALAQHGLTFHPELSHVFAGHSESDVAEESYAFAKKVLSQADTRPDGLIATNDFVAHGVLRAMSEMGIIPGQHIHIASLANRGSLVLQEYKNKIIMMEFDPDLLAERIVELLLEQINSPSSVGEVRVVRPSINLPSS